MRAFIDHLWLRRALLIRSPELCDRASCADGFFVFSELSASRSRDGQKRMVRLSANGLEPAWEPVVQLAQCSLLRSCLRARRRRPSDDRRWLFARTENYFRCAAPAVQQAAGPAGNRQTADSAEFTYSAVAQLDARLAAICRAGIGIFRQFQINIC